MALQKIGLVGATAVAALLALSPLGVSTQGPALQTALADNGDKGGASGRDGGGGRAGGSDSADAGKAGGGGNSGSGSNVSGTEGNQGNKGTMGNAGRSFAGSMPGTGVVTKGDDDDDDTQISEKPKDVSPPIGNTVGQRDRRDGSPPFGNAFGHRDRQGVAKDDSHARAANLLGNLNAAHASPTARANAAPNSMVGQIAAYETAMQQALALNDAARRDAAIIAAREQLAQAANKPLTAEAIAQVDQMLGIQGASPQLGALR